MKKCTFTDIVNKLLLAIAVLNKLLFYFSAFWTPVHINYYSMNNSQDKTTTRHEWNHATEKCITLHFNHSIGLIIHYISSLTYLTYSTSLPHDVFDTEHWNCEMQFAPHYIFVLLKKCVKHVLMQQLTTVETTETAKVPHILRVLLQHNWLCKTCFHGVNNCHWRIDTAIVMIVSNRKYWLSPVTYGTVVHYK